MGGGSSGGGSIASDLIGVVAGLKAADAMGGQLGNMFSGLGQQPESTPSTANEKPESSGWDCSCGHKGNRGKYCEECGLPQPVEWDCSCGHKGNRGKFCEECGAMKPSSWECSCGHKGNRGKYCEECAKPKEDN